MLFRSFFAILCTFRGQNRRLKFLFLCSLFSLFSGVLWLGRSLEDDAYIRYLAPSLLLVQAFSLALLGDLRSLPLKSRERNLLLLALLLLAPVFRPHIPWRIPFFTSAPDYLSAYREQADGGACKAWLASQIGKEDSVLSLQDFGLYLVGTRNIRIGILDRELDDLIRAQSSPELLFGEFRKKGFRWVYQLDPQDAEPYLPHAARITAWMRQQKQELVFDRRDCLVLDLKAQGS